eukprot:m51a1_g2758 hypothetical protein (236) ;mRNA; r:970964-971789
MGKRLAAAVLVQAAIGLAFLFVYAREVIQPARPLTSSPLVARWSDSRFASVAGAVPRDQLTAAEAMAVAEQLTPRSRAFAWGTGRCALVAAPAVARYAAVDSDPEELAQTIAALGAPAGSDILSKALRCEGSSAARCSEYIEYIANASRAAGSKFDRVFVLGSHARAQCALRALSELESEDSIVFVRGWGLESAKRRRDVMKFYKQVGQVGAITMLRPRAGAIEAAAQTPDPAWF